MRHQTKKSLTPGGKSGRSKIIQLETLNSLYFKHDIERFGMCNILLSDSRPLRIVDEQALQRRTQNRAI